MSLWSPYLIDLLGHDDYGRARVGETEALARSIQSERLTAQDLVGLLDWLEELDAFRQFYILPSVLDLVREESPSLRGRVLRFAGELLGGAFGPLLSEVLSITSSDQHVPERLRSILGSIAGILSESAAERDASETDGLATLIEDRTLIFAFSLLHGLFAWLDGQPAREELQRVYTDFFNEDEQDGLRQLLLELLTESSVFVRYLVVRWIGSSGVELDEVRALDLLFDRYRNDPAPVVAATALEGYARLTQPSEVGVAIRRIEIELRTLQERQAPFEHSTLLSPSEGARCLSSALLRALGTLAQHHPFDPEPRAALRRVVTARPTRWVDLSMTQPPEVRKRVFRAALALRGGELRFRVRRIRREKGRLVGEVGLNDPVALQEPPPSPRGQDSYWYRLAKSTPRGPLLQIVEPPRHPWPTTSDLLGVITPRIDTLATWEPPRFSTPAWTEDCERELANRATWSCAAVEAVSLALSALRDAKGILDEGDPDIDALLVFLIETAEAAEHVRYNERIIGRDGVELRNRTRAILLNRFATQSFFDRLFAGSEADAVRAHLLTALAMAAMRSLSDDVAQAWIHGNLPLLRHIAASTEYPLIDRATAAIVTRLRTRRLATADDDWTVVIDHDGSIGRTALARVLPFLPDAKLREMHVRLSGGADRRLLMSRPEDATDGPRQLAVRSETVARALDTGSLGGGLDDEVAICLAAAASPDRDLLSDATRRRLAKAFVWAPDERRRGSMQRLFEQLVRTATSAQLEAVLYEAHHRAEPALGEYLSRLMERRLARTDSGKPLVAGRQFDVQTVVDLTARLHVPLRHLYRMARENRDFARDYLARRQTWSGRRDTARVAQVQGSVRRMGGIPEDILPAELYTSPPQASRQSIAENSVDVVPTFVHYTRGETEVRCLAVVQRVPRGTVDFHLPSLRPSDRRKLADTLVSRQGVLRIAARVVGERPGRRHALDFGVQPIGHAVREDLTLGRDVRPGDVVVVQLRRDAPHRLVIVSGRFERHADLDDDDVVDLRGKPDAIDWLEKSAARGKLLLRATVVHHFERDDGKVKCFCEAGFRLHHKEARDAGHPWFLSEGSAVPVEGTEVVIAASGLYFQRGEFGADLREAVEVVSTGVGLNEGETAVGHLRWERPGSRRQWFAELRGARVAVPRRHVTSDLLRLFELDDLNEDAPFLQRLGSTPLEFRVLRGGQGASLVEANPRCTVEDLVVLVASGTVERATVVRVDDRVPRGIVLELAGTTPLEDDLGDATVLSVGTLAYVSQAQLFDPLGEPVAIDELRPGMRLSLTVWELPDQHERSSSKRPRPALQLRLTEDPDEENLAIEAMFSAQELVRVRVSADGMIELADPTEGVPRPSVEFAMPPEGRYFEPNSTVDAMVSQRWDPWSLEYLVRVQRVRATALHIDSARQANEVRFYLGLEPGDMIGKTCRYSWKDASLVCRTGGLYLVIDALTHYLLPAARGVQPQDIRSQVILTEVRTKDRWSYESFPAEAIPELGDRESLTGLVDSIPHRDSGSSQIGVRWIRGDLEDQDSASARVVKGSLEVKEAYHNGDILTARRTGGQVVVDRRTRQLKGSFLHAPRSVGAWIAAARRERLELVDAALLQRAEENGTWLFCMKPASLVEVPRTDLGRAELLGDAQALDLVKLRIVRSADGDAALEVESTDRGALARAQGLPFQLKFTWYDRRAELFEGKLAGPSELAGLPPIELKLRSKDLPPGQDAHRLASRILTRERPSLTCTLDGFQLRAWRDGTVWRFGLACTLGRYDAHRSAAQIPLKPSLEGALDERGRIDGARGKIVAQAGGLAVHLALFAHDEPLPLPAEEQTWFPLTGHVPSAGWTGDFAILRDDRGRPYASLRRLRPRTLEEWLHFRKHRSLPRTLHLPMHYFGPLSEKDRDACGLATGPLRGEGGNEEDIPLVLFEVGPGETFTAAADQLRFLGEPFDPKVLHPGDEVSEVEVLRTGGESGAQGDPILDILDFTLDIVEDLETFANGSLFAKVARVDDALEIIELYGLSFSKNRVKPQRIGRWRLVLTDVTEEDVERVLKRGEGQLVYLKFVCADPANGLLLFRLATMTEVFARNNYVYVVAKGVVSPYGGSLKLEVRPIDDGLKGDYFIPENLFSERRGRLQALDRAQGCGIFLACVQEVPEPGKERGQPGSSYKLTLLRNPRRRFRYMMIHSEWQVIIKERSNDGNSLYVEAGIGVVVDLPLHRIGLGRAGESEAGQPRPRIPRPGETLFLERVRRERRLVILDCVPGHLDYLHLDRYPIVLTTLWGKSNSLYRRRKLEKSRPLECNVVALPQLQASCHVSPENALVERPLPQQVLRVIQGGRLVALTDEIRWSENVLGRLSFDDAGHPTFETRSTGKIYFLPRTEVTFFPGTTREVAARIAAQRWQDDATSEPRGIADADLVGLFPRELGVPSLTAMASRPVPVDHLVEQFSPPRSGGNRARRSVQVLSFVVGRNDRDRLILEVAPGRYAELPTALIRPLQLGAELAEGKALSWRRLTAGDEVAVELLPPTDTDAFLPRFRIRELIARSGRQLARPLAVPICRRGDRSLVFGTADGPGVPASNLSALLQNEVADLRGVGNIAVRYHKVSQLVSQYGSRLVLEGSVVGKTAVGGGTLYFIGVGIQVPLDDGSRKDPALFVPLGDSGYQNGDPLHLRVFEARFEGSTLVGFRYAVERKLERFSDWALVRGSGSEFAHADRPQIGDSVLVHRPDGVEGANAVATGFEHLELRWERTDCDDLHLELPSERREVFDHLLADGGSFWATCEAVGERVLTLSRRVQLEDALPAPGEVVQAKLLKAMSDRRWLVDLHGVPMALFTRRLFHGPTFAVRQLSAELSRTLKRGLDVEVVRAADGRLSATDVYKQPPARELEAEVEATVEAGALVIAAGSRLFVPAGELTWCGELEEPLLQQLFPPGKRLRVARRPDRLGKGGRWSHVAIYDIRTDVDEMTRTLGAVSVTAVARAGERTIVRAPSGVLMELRASPAPENGTRLVAFVQRVDDVNRRIQLALKEVPRQHWSFLQVEGTREERIAAHSDETFQGWVRELEAALRAKGPGAVHAWAGRRGLRHDPETVRIVLDTLGAGAALVAPGDREGEGTETPLQRLLRHVASALDGGAEELPLTANDRFALGYWLLIHGRADEALPHLREIPERGSLADSFAFQLTKAVAYERSGLTEEAALALRTLLDRLWANAVRTMSVPVIEPPSFDLQDETRVQWSEALAHGDLDQLETIVSDQPAAFQTSASGLVFQVWRAVVEERRGGFDDLVDRFFDALRQDQEESGGTLDPRVFALAAFLEFSRGRTAEGWGWLDRIEAGVPAVAVPAFWRQHLKAGPTGAPGLDPVLTAAAALHRRCRWSRELDPALLDRLWDAYRGSQHRWILDIPVVRPLGPFPEEEDPGAIEQWAKLNAMEDGLEALLEEFESERDADAP